MNDVERVLARFKAVVLMCYPDDMTPAAKRAFESVIEAELERLAENRGAGYEL